MSNWSTVHWEQWDVLGLMTMNDFMNIAYLFYCTAMAGRIEDPNAGLRTCFDSKKIAGKLRSNRTAEDSGASAGTDAGFGGPTPFCLYSQNKTKGRT